MTTTLRLNMAEPVVVRRDTGGCMVKGCGYFASIVRSTRQGWFLIAYCRGHERMAHELFGDEADE